MLRYVRPGYVRFGQVIFGCNMLVQVMSGYDWLGEVRQGYIRLGQLRSR
jgi:hypothetical protein